MEVGQPFFGERIQRQGDAGGHADAFRALPEQLHEHIRVGVRLGSQQFRREPQNALGFVRDRQVSDVLFEVGEDLDLGDGFVVGNVHNPKDILLHRTAERNGGFRRGSDLVGNAWEQAEVPPQAASLAEPTLHSEL